MEASYFTRASASWGLGGSCHLALSLQDCSPLSRIYKESDIQVATKVEKSKLCHEVWGFQNNWYGLQPASFIHLHYSPGLYQPVFSQFQAIPKHNATCSLLLGGGSGWLQWDTFILGMFGNVIFPWVPRSPKGQQWGAQIENWGGMTSLLLYLRRKAGYELITKILKIQSWA